MKKMFCRNPIKLPDLLKLKSIKWMGIVRVCAKPKKAGKGPNTEKDAEGKSPSPEE